MKRKNITPVQKFFDFYSIVELYLRCGGFRESGYSQYNVFINFRAEEMIREAYEELVDDFYDEIHAALATSIKSELSHYPTQCESCSCDRRNLEKNNITKDIIKLAKKFPEKNLRIVHRIFSLHGWYGSSYGGKKWAKGVKLLIESHNIKSRQDKIYWIDCVLDLYHNCGHMINKTKYKVLSQRSFDMPRSSTPLNFRAKAKSILEFLPLNSDRVKRLIIPRKNILTKP